MVTPRDLEIPATLAGSLTVEGWNCYVSAKLCEV